MPASSASVNFPTARTSEPGVLEVRVVQEEFKHDIAIFRVPAAGAGKAHYRTGTPVSIDWRSERESSTFTGFVHHVEQPSAAKDTSIWCKGASTRFDNGLQATYRYRTATSVASEIARQLNFDADIVPHGRVFEALTATGGRTWDFLVANAQEIGYSFYAKNTRLMLHPRLHNVTLYKSQAPVFHLGGDGDRGTLWDFHPIDGAALAGTQRHDNVYVGTDRRTGRPFSVRGGPAAGTLGKAQYGATGQTFHNLNVSTPEEARWKAVAQAENDRFNMHATCRVEGSARVHQTWPVILDGVNGQYEGAWFVHRVVHRLVPGEYVMDLELGRDAYGSSGDVPDPRSRRVVATRDAPGGRPKSAYPATVLVNGQWRSQWSAPGRG